VVTRAFAFLSLPRSGESRRSGGGGSSRRTRRRLAATSPGTISRDVRPTEEEPRRAGRANPFRRGHGRHRSGWRCLYLPECVPARRPLCPGRTSSRGEPSSRGELPGASLGGGGPREAADRNGRRLGHGPRPQRGVRHPCGTRWLGGQRGAFCRYQLVGGANLASPGRVRRSSSGHSSLHRHRFLDGDRGAAGGRCVARSPRPTQPGGPRSTRPVSGA